MDQKWHSTILQKQLINVSLNYLGSGKPVCKVYEMSRYS